MRQRQAALRQLYLSQMTLAQQAWESGRVVRVMELLDGQRQFPGQQDLRDFDWYYRWRFFHERASDVARREDEVGSVAFFPRWQDTGDFDEGD